MMIVVGEILIDIFDDYWRIGGAPFNFAFHVKQMGWPVRLFTRVGQDAYGKDILDLLAKHGFSTRDVQIDARRPTGSVRVALDQQGVPQFDIRTDVAYDCLDLKTVGSIDWPSVRMIYLGTLAQRTHGGFNRIQQFVMQRAPGTKVFCDINLRPPHVNVEAVKASLQQADIVKLNTEELAKIQGLFDGLEPTDGGVEWLMQGFSVEMLILTRGREGSTIHTAQQTVTVPPATGDKIIDTVGAGDAYAAVSAVGYLTGMPLDALAEAASAFAAQICALPGAVPEDEAVYRGLRQKMEGSVHGQ